MGQGGVKRVEPRTGQTLEGSMAWGKAECLSSFVLFILKIEE